MKTLIYLFCALLLVACPGTDKQIEQAAKELGKKLKTNPDSKCRPPESVEPIQNPTGTLFNAVNANDVCLIDRAIKAGADVNARNAYGEPALIVAAMYDRTEAVRTLLEKGADVEAMDTYGRTALIQVALNSRMEIFRALIGKGANVNARDKYGDTALIKAIRNGYTAIAAILQRAGATQ